MTNKPKIDALTKLINSNGWQVLHAAMNDEIVAAAMAIANDPSMSHDEINFRRGSIWAAKQLLQTPQLLIAKMENDDILDTHKHPRDEK